MDFYSLQAIFEQIILFQQSLCFFFFARFDNFFISTAAFETVAIGGKSEII